MRVAAAQAHPVWLDADATTSKVLTAIHEASDQDVDLVAFPESFLPGYPFWVMLGGATTFNEPRQNAAYAAYLDAAVEVRGSQIAQVTEAASDLGVMVYLGIAERGGRKCVRDAPRNRARAWGAQRAPQTGPDIR